MAQEALARIAALYAIEAQGRDMTVEERTPLRQEHAQPQLQSMHDWLLKTRVTVANGGGTAKAIDYSLKRWAALSRYATDGRLPIDNNPVENTIRPIALGKKNWLFAGSERAGKRAAAIQTLLGTANSMGLIRRRGCGIRWRDCRPASTARSIRCCRCARNRYLKANRDRLDAYGDSILGVAYRQEGDLAITRRSYTPLY